MLILGLDFESTWTDPVDPKKCNIIEIGAVLFDTEAKVPVVVMNRTVWEDSYPFDPRITGLTGMTEEHLKRFGSRPKMALEKLVTLMSHAEAIVAHNGTNFDKPLLEAECARHGVPLPAFHWIDTCVDVPYPAKIETRKLEFLGPSHGFLNPFSHRAIFDVLTMLKVMEKYDFKEIHSQSLKPSISVRADIVKPFGKTEVLGKKQNEQAKARGYRWNGTIWSKSIKEDQIDDEIKNAPFPVIVLR